jgi:hypothetical protein
MKISKQKRRGKEAIKIQECIDGVQDSLDRFQVAYEQSFDLDAAMGDLLAYVSDLEDAVEKIEP